MLGWFNGSEVEGLAFESVLDKAFGVGDFVDSADFITAERCQSTLNPKP
jgi:hypothetical protein